MEGTLTQISGFFMEHEGIAMIVNFLIKHADFILGIIINLILISIFCKLADAFNAKVEKSLLKKHPDSPLINLMPILTRIAKVVIIFVLLAGFLQSFGYNVNSLIAGFGITGLAVGFAAKEAIGNVFGSIGLLADRVYKVGDYIAFDNYEGTVTEINFRSTTIKTIQGFEVNIPRPIRNCNGCKTAAYRPENSSIYQKDTCRGGRCVQSGDRIIFPRKVSPDTPSEMDFLPPARTEQSNSTSALCISGTGKSV